MKNKFLALVLVFFSIFNVSFADTTTNKASLITEIETTQKSILEVKTAKLKDLETKVYSLTKEYDNSVSSLWYDLKTIDYLVSLWKISSNFKQDLLSQFNETSSDIETKFSLQSNSLNQIKNEVNFSNSISDSQKQTLLTKIQEVQKNYKDLDSTFTTKITNINTTFTTNLTSYKNSLKTAYEANKTWLKTLSDFSSKMDLLYTLNQDFQKNYLTFKDNYLSYAWELSTFSENKQKEYVSLLKTDLEKLRDDNFTANKNLEQYKIDIDRLIDILIENFTNSLKNNVSNNYWIIYWETDIDSINFKYTNLKNKYLDLNQNIKPSEVLAWTWALEELNFVSDKITWLNSKIKQVIWTGSTATLAWIKVKIENDMVSYYNSNYDQYRQDLILKLKEKVSLLNQDAKNVLLADDNINIKFDMLLAKIKPLTDTKAIRLEIDKFKTENEKYSYLKSSIINDKIENLNNNLEIFWITKETSFVKYRKYSFKKYQPQVEKFISNTKQKYPENYKSKFKTIISKIDTALSKNISDKNKYILLQIKYTLLKAM